MARTFVLTPYQATKAFNAHRVELGLKEVQSPFMYIQARKGRFTINLSADGRKQIADREQWAAWAYAHNMRQAARKAQANGAQDLLQRAICA